MGTHIEFLCAKHEKMPIIKGFFSYIKKLDSSVEKTKNAVLNSICF